MATYQGLIPRIRWGASYDQELVFALPLDSPLSWPDPAEGSSFAMSDAGVEDAWVTATDYFLGGIMRRIPRDRSLNPPATGWNETNGVEAWLTWMRTKGIGRFYPDGRNLIDSPKLATFVGGVATDWTSFIASGTFSFVGTGDPAQKITCSGSTGSVQWAAITQNIYGIKEFDVLAFSLACKTAALVNIAPLVVIDWETSAGASISQTTFAPTTGAAFTRSSLVAAAPATCDRAQIQIRMQTSAAGASGDGIFKEVMVERKASAAALASAAFIDNPGYRTVYLKEPMSGKPDAEMNLLRVLNLILRASDRLPFVGY